MEKLLINYYYIALLDKVECNIFLFFTGMMFFTSHTAVICEMKFMVFFCQFNDFLSKFWSANEISHQRCSIALI